MDTKGTMEEKATSEPARPAPEVPGPEVTGAAPPAPLSGSGEGAADDSLDGFHTAFKGLFVDEESAKGPGKEKRKRAMDAEDGQGDEGAEPTLATPSSSAMPFVSAPGATPLTTPPMAETAAGSGYTGMPTHAHPAYGAASPSFFF